MHPDVRKLLDLQEIDQEVAYLRRDLDSLPIEEANRKQRLSALNDRWQQQRATHEQTEVKSRTVEKSIQQADEEIKKLEARLNGVRNNAEYQATLLQIESVKRERDSMQEEGLVLLEQLEGIGSTVKEAEAAAAAEEEVYQGFQQEAQQIRDRSQAGLDEVMQRRNAKTEGIPPDLMATYERLFEVRSGVAVCPVEKENCQGCFTKITTNDIARLMGGSSVVICGSCQRILYLPE